MKRLAFVLVLLPALAEAQKPTVIVSGDGAATVVSVGTQGPAGANIPAAGFFPGTAPHTSLTIQVFFFVRTSKNRNPNGISAMGHVFLPTLTMDNILLEGSIETSFHLQSRSLIPYSGHTIYRGVPCKYMFL